MPRIVEIAGRKVGDGQPVFVSAELGLNHNGDLDLAKRMITAAKECGCDSVKVQNYRVQDFITEKSQMYDNGHGWVENYWDMCKRHQWDFFALAAMKAHADSVGILFHSTPTGKSGVDELEQLGVPFYKNGADGLTNLQLFGWIGATGKPVVFSVDWRESHYSVVKALGAYYGSGGTAAIILHTVREYPAKIPHLYAMDQYTVISSEEPFGYSDHVIGIRAAIDAAELGACWIEKHFTLDKSMKGPDHWYSADPQEMSALIQALRSAGRK